MATLDGHRLTRGAGRPSASPESFIRSSPSVPTADAKQHAIRAAGVVSDVRLNPPLEGDALRLDFEHVDGAALVALLPYVQSPGSATEYGDVSIMAGRRRVWD